VDRHEAQLARAGVGEAVWDVGWPDDDVTGLNDDPTIAELEHRLTGLNDEHLGVGMTV
jgi:hypothetical protein